MAHRVLLVEDNPGDVRLLLEVFHEQRPSPSNPIKIDIVSDGVAALDFLRQQGPYRAALRPDMILLDLNLPKKDGREVLTEIRQDPQLSIIPVLVLTTSSAEQDILHSYRLHANCFITKPVDFKNFLRVANAIEKFWLDVATLPA